ncbi:MAG TPA: ABC transporter substrate-binding protein, partial [Terrimicrobiaceae bacterium]
MKNPLTILLAMLLLMAVTEPATRAETTVKILHLQDDPKYLEIWRQIGVQFEKQNPGVKIDWQFLENEAFKAKLPTTLQSGERPHIFYSWAGGVFIDQARAGVLTDITQSMEGEWAASLSPTGVKAFTYDGKVYGAPLKTSLEILWYNKALLEKAGVDPASLATWSGFLEAVKKCKAAGITPLATGGGDKWPLHFYWTMLALRIGGQEAFEAAYNRQGEGF